MEGESEEQFLAFCCRGNRLATGLCTSSRCSRCGISRIVWKRLCRQPVGGLQMSGQSDAVFRMDALTLLAT